MAVTQVRRLKEADEFRAHLAGLGVDLPFDPVVDPAGTLARPMRMRDGTAGELVAGNRWCVLPMEGWDATTDGRPTDLVRRRWTRFGGSGAKLVWGGEAVAVVPEGRANPNQLCIGPTSTDDLAGLRQVLVDAHTERFGTADDLLVGLQLTHSGRWPFGGDLEGRSRFLCRTISGIRDRVPGLAVGVRLSTFDLAPHVPGPNGTGVAEAGVHHAFGGDGTEPEGHDEVDRLLAVLADLGVGTVCVTAGSPYYCPHAQRPAFFPPSDGYLPPRDPLVDVARLVGVAAELKARHPDLAVVGSGYSYLQEWLPNVAQAVVGGGGADSVGIGRMVLSYPDLPADVLAGRPLDRRRLCRTFSDCTTAPRHGLVSGCFPLDDHYKAMPERLELTRVKREAEAARGGRRR